MRALLKHYFWLRSYCCLKGETNLVLNESCVYNNRKGHGHCWYNFGCNQNIEKINKTLQTVILPFTFNLVWLTVKTQYGGRFQNFQHITQTSLCIKNVTCWNTRLQLKFQFQKNLMKWGKKWLAVHNFVLVSVFLISKIIKNRRYQRGPSQKII